MTDFNFPNGEQPGRYGRLDTYGDPYRNKTEEKNVVFLLLDMILELPTKIKIIAGVVILVVIFGIIGACSLMGPKPEPVQEPPAAPQAPAVETKADPSKFDPTAYGITIEVTDVLDAPVPYTIISAYVDDLSDFEAIKQAVYDASIAYGLGDKVGDIIGSFDAIAGTDGSSPTDVPENGDPWQLVTITPVGDQPYCVDLYIARK